MTLQAKNLKEKLIKTMQGFRRLCCTGSNCNISFDRCICVLISPHWIDFDVNYDAMKESVTGAASKKPDK